VQVRFAGFLNQSEMPAAYGAGDCLALPSDWAETWGLVVNEALHHGVPCVVSDRVGAVPDLIDDQTGAVFLAGQVDSFTRALRRVEPLIGRPRVREACRARVRPYSVLAAAQGIAEAYHAALDRRSRDSS
jgi:glycosyltransferase involved in cell wall biosynthesis